MKVAFNPAQVQNRFKPSFGDIEADYIIQDRRLLEKAFDEEIIARRQEREAMADLADPRTIKNILSDIFAPNSPDTLKRKIHRNLALIGFNSHAQYEIEHYTNHKLNIKEHEGYYTAMDYSPKKGNVDEKIAYYQRMSEFESKIDLLEDVEVLKRVNSFFKRFTKQEVVATRLPDIEILLDIVDKSLENQE